MTKKKFIPPERIEKIPPWLYGSLEENNIDDKVAEDIISLHYWNEIDNKAHTAALAHVKLHKDWVVTKTLENQTGEIQALYEVKRAEEMVKWEGILENDIYARARVMAEASDSAFDWTNAFQPIVEQAQMRIMLKIKNSGMLAYLEHNTVADFIRSKQTPWDGTGNRPGVHYEVDFLTNYLLPLLEKNGFSENLVIGVGLNLWKARVAIPYIKIILSDILEKTDEIMQAKEEAEKEGASDKELSLFDEALEEAMALDTRLHDALEALVTEMTLSKSDGGMSVAEFRKHIKKLTKKNGTTKKANGFTYITATGGAILVNCDSKAMFTAIKQLLSELVDFHLSTPEELAVEVGKRLLASNQSEELKEIMFKK